MTFDHLRRIALDRNALDHIRVKGALREKFVTAVSATGQTRCGEFARAVLAVFFEQFPGRVLKYFNEFAADDLAFLLRIGHAFECAQESFAGVHIFEAHAKIFAKDALHHFLLARAEQPVINEDAGELVADRLVQKRGGDGRIDAAAQTEHDFFITDLAPDALAGFLDERAHRPIHRAMADVVDEVLQDLSAARRVCHFGMKLDG